jgi:hypothetical protein
MAASIEHLGREHGWLATHHEVVEWLEQVAGVDLARKRERIALAASEKHPLPAAAPVEPAGTASATGELRVPTRGPRPLLVVAVLASLAVAAIAAWSLSRPQPPPRPATESPPPNGSATAVVTVATSPPEPSAPAPVNDVAERAAAPVAPSATAKPKAASHSAKSATSAATPLPGARPPSQIAKKNPYRD